MTKNLTSLNLSSVLKTKEYIIKCVPVQDTAQILLNG